jgi:hypothetical protein
MFEVEGEGETWRERRSASPRLREMQREGGMFEIQRERGSVGCR